MANQLRIPTATYRLQLNRHFTFKSATEILPYLQQLGISDIYSSPFFRSRRGSDHGYDVSNHNELNPILGTQKDFDTFVAALRERDMGQIADFVPNHMGITDPENEWWMDVLENGPSANYAPFFDIDWHPLKKQLENKVLLPILGDQYGRVLERGEFHLEFEDGAFFLKYHEWIFPLNPRTYHFILRSALEKLERYTDQEMTLELESIITALDHLPLRTQTDEDQVRERAREKEVAKRRILRLVSEYPQVEDAIQLTISELEGRFGKPRSFDRLDELLGAQSYRLSYWKVAAEEINYRRFFDVNELAAIRVELPIVFDTIHQLVFELLKDRAITGLRIDHVDGLQDPKYYLSELQHKFAEVAGSESEDGKNLYLIAEKILCGNEKLRVDWPIYGTTGYEFSADINQLLTDNRNGDEFSRIYRTFIDRFIHLDSLIHEKKRLVMDVLLASDIESLGQQLSDLAERDRLHRDFTLDSLRTVVRELIAGFPVYRTYISEQSGVSEVDRKIVTRAIRAAKRRNASIDESVFDFLRDVVLLEKFEYFDEETRKMQLQFVLKLQQCTGPIMAKGLEDTSFYIFNRLTALNEVGGDPGQFGATLESFHEENRNRLAEMPHSLLTLTTHDTKRSEDVRARILVLSEIPKEWQSWINEWRELNSKLKADVDGESAPSANEEYLFYQTVLGTWPLVAKAVDNDYVDRIQQYMTKAVREAKVNSSWIQPNEAWEKALKNFVSGTLNPESAFRAKIEPATTTIAWFGMLNSLSQTILKMTVPGVPDFYQGTEIWDFSLVDPDNRRLVDYAARQHLLTEVQDAPLEALFKNWQDGKIKLSVITRLLNFRKLHPEIFNEGNYRSFYASGELAECCISFAREYEEATVLVIVPRFGTRLGEPSSQFDWKDTHLPLDGSLPTMHDLLTGGAIKAGIDSLELRNLNAFPFAVFHNLNGS